MASVGRIFDHARTCSNELDVFINFASFSPFIIRMLSRISRKSSASNRETISTQNAKNRALSPRGAATVVNSKSVSPRRHGEHGGIYRCSKKGKNKAQRGVPRCLRHSWNQPGVKLQVSCQHGRVPRLLRDSRVLSCACKSQSSRTNRGTRDRHHKLPGISCRASSTRAAKNAALS